METFRAEIFNLCCPRNASISIVSETCKIIFPRILCRSSITRRSSHFREKKKKKKQCYPTLHAATRSTNFAEFSIVFAGSELVQYRWCIKTRGSVSRVSVGRVSVIIRAERSGGMRSISFTCHLGKRFQPEENSSRSFRFSVHRSFPEVLPFGDRLELINPPLRTTSWKLLYENLIIERKFHFYNISSVIRVLLLLLLLFSFFLFLTQFRRNVGKWNTFFFFLHFVELSPGQARDQIIIRSPSLHE